MVTIIDYKAGNLTSVKNAFAAIGEEAVVTSDPETIRKAARVVFPGVGAAASAMANLRALGLTDVVREAANSGRPFLGICLGMQILFECSEEDGGVDTLGVLPGKVKRFPDVAGFKVPEIGWNQVEVKRKSEKGKSIIGGEVRSERPTRRSALPDAKLPSTLYSLPSEFYFVHSYYAEVCPYTVGFTEYAGVEFTAMVKKGNLWACQFHPEKSGRVGLELLKEWLCL